MEREKNFQRFLLLAMAVLAIIFYEGKLCWELIILAAYTGALYGFFCVALRKAGEADRASLRYGICFFAIFAVPVYAAASYFATPQVIVMTVGILLLLVMLAEKKRRDGLFGGAALALAVLIAYLPRKDVNMAEDETVHAVVDQFGGVLSEKMAVADLAVFLVLMLPYLWIAVSFFRSLIREIFGVIRRAGNISSGWPAARFCSRPSSFGKDTALQSLRSCSTTSLCGSPGCPGEMTRCGKPRIPAGSGSQRWGPQACFF